MSVWGFFLCRLAAQDAVTIGTTVIGRDLSGTERLVGYFQNTLPVRCCAGSVSGGFPDLVVAVRDEAIQLFSHSLCPWPLVLQHVELGPDDPSRNAVFQTMFTFLRSDDGEQV